ncbi:carboxymuconolactone decarboxylase family protein [Zavarzinia aquatilis]|uniref:Carboxymuconolactone decarboxylase family protein n=1 Tax=Zavarzinia aquatilis TaxID=2211142 RepID=A0A317EC04_9PROT|nr:carboxymuconolactone decarboxylase family protein [Zavarzinia aquatilis]PWR24152.1 hypothetical protein DKG74_08495 [Zavarzinia aquatilis]
MDSKTSRHAPPRVAPLPSPPGPDIAAAFAKAVPPPFTVPGLYQTVARNEKVFLAFAEAPLLSRRGLMHTGQISDLERELVILRITGRLGAAHEWGVHVAYFGKTGGMTASQIEDTVRSPLTPALWTERQQAIVRLIDDLVERHDVSDESFAMARRTLSEADVIEVVTLAGLYNMIAWNVRALRVAEEPGAPPFPWPVWRPIASPADTAR